MYVGNEYVCVYIVSLCVNVMCIGGSIEYATLVARTLVATARSLAMMLASSLLFERAAGQPCALCVCD